MSITIIFKSLNKKDIEHQKHVQNQIPCPDKTSSSRSGVANLGKSHAPAHWKNSLTQ